MTVSMSEKLQILSMYRKIPSALDRYLVFQYIKITAEEETGEKFTLPEKMKKLDTIYKAYCLTCKDIENMFSEEERASQKEELTNILKADMADAYCGKK